MCLVVSSQAHMSALSAASCLKSQVLTIYRKRPILCRTKSGLLIEILNISSVTWTTCFPLLKKKLQNYILEEENLLLAYFYKTIGFLISYVCAGLSHWLHITFTFLHGYNTINTDDWILIAYLFRKANRIIANLLNTSDWYSSLIAFPCLGMPGF